MRFLTKIIQVINRGIFLRNRDNSPFLSGDSFAKLAEYYVYGKQKNKSVDLAKLRDAKSLFVPGDKLAEFLRVYKDSIFAKVMIIGNSDENFDTHLDFPKSLKMILCQNSTISDDKKIFTLPIGLENRRLARSGNPRLYKIKSSAKRYNKVYVPPMSPTNPVRISTLNEIKSQQHNIFVVDESYKGVKSYLKEVTKYQFILCLEGNGYENHRIWESLYLGVFPVVFETEWSKTLKYLELPILYIKSIDEITDASLASFANLNNDFSPKKKEELWMPFWDKLVQSKL
jgi:hypothetical protein